MKRIILTILALALMVPLTGCEDAPATGETDNPGAEIQGNTPEETPDPDPIGEPDPDEATHDPEETEPPAETDGPDVELIDWQGIYRSFLSDNYEALADACMVGMVGVGFIDLDSDRVPEILIFDAGASASMGVQIFDIIDDEVSCVSAHIDAIGEEFGGSYLTDVKINANHFSDFRLIQGNSLSERIFYVESANGGVDFNFSELIVFYSQGADSIAQPVKKLYREAELDGETGETLSEGYRSGDSEISRAEYEAEYEEFFGGFEQLDYAAAGAFIWESGSYESGYDGFMAMADAAIKAYVPLPER